MKKSTIVFGIFTICIIILFLSSTKAAVGTTNPLPENLTKNAEKATGIIQNINNLNYLEQQWQNYFNNTKNGKKVYAIAMFPKKFNLFWKYFVGMEFSYSQMFILVLLLWALILVYSSRMLDFLAIYSIWLKVLGVIIVSFILSTTKVIAGIAYIANLILNLLPYILIARVVGWILILWGCWYLIFVSGLMKKLSAQWRKSAEEAKAKRDMKNKIEKARRTAEEAKRMVREQEGENEEDTESGQRIARGKELLEGIGESLEQEPEDLDSLNTRAIKRNTPRDFKI